MKCIEKGSRSTPALYLVKVVREVKAGVIEKRAAHKMGGKEQQWELSQLMFADALLCWLTQRSSVV